MANGNAAEEIRPQRKESRNEFDRLFCRKMLLVDSGEIASNPFLI